MTAKPPEFLATLAGDALSWAGWLLVPAAALVYALLVIWAARNYYRDDD